jgi:hypothetical protein
VGSDAILFLLVTENAAVDEREIHNQALDILQPARPYIAIPRSDALKFEINADFTLEWR